MLATGVTIGERYEVQDLLGRGGMAEVFRAHDLVGGEAVALKLLRDVQPRSVRRFEDELNVLRRLDHPGVVGVHDSGTHEDAPYLVLELIDGASLADLLLDGPLGLERSIDIGRQLAEALAYAHAHDVVHRDLKPGNVLCERASGRVCLTDFGIARFDEDATRMTAPGALMGTAAYLAPEQLGGQIRPSVDVYALGLVVLECLTGARCYSGTMIETAMARLHRPPVIPLGAPPWLRHTLAAMTATDPTRRPAAGAVAAAFRTHSVDPVLPSTAAFPAHARHARLADVGPGDEDPALVTTAELDLSDRPTRMFALDAQQRPRPPAEVGPLGRAAALIALAISVVIGLVAARGALDTSAADPAFTPTPAVEAGPTTTSSLNSAAKPSATQPPAAAQSRPDENQDDDNAGTPPADPADNTGPGNGNANGHTRSHGHDDG